MKNMKYIYGIFVGVVTMVALAWVIHLGIQGKPITKIKLSEFKSSDEIAQALIMRLRQELKDHPILFLGVDPEVKQHFLIVQSFLKQADEPGWSYHQVWVDESLASEVVFRDFLTKGVGVIALKEQEATVKAHWPSVVEGSQRVVVIVPHVYASQLIKNNPVQRIKEGALDSQILSVTFVPLAESSESSAVNRLPCVAEGVDHTGQSPLGCVIRQKSRFWKKPFKKEIQQGLLEQYGLRDYLFFLTLFD